ncbi:hypothetical protein FHX74_002555 [Friedmanniella endophytica]|uniref:Uncharacterized protein n=1 Tax=Microlunatus kandeliicorticis TaxID=1759536 RepID=A0A7W3ITF5_9ACTN|nr:hypothetical protein [Microlunatus kandeliicorticis]MBA8794927.1 hypothetical protein [Microlunatus kandeliicorticis]
MIHPIKPISTPERSRLPRYASNDPILTKALGEIGDVLSTLAILDRIAADTAKIDHPGAARKLTDKIFAGLTDGDGLADNLLAQYAKASATDAAWDTMRAEMQTLADSLGSAVDRDIQAGFDQMCQFLDKRVKSVFAELQGMGRVPVTAEAAIDAGQVELYQTAGQLRRDYHQIRQAQRTLFTHGLTEVDRFTFNNQLRRWWDVLALSPNLAAVWPGLPEYMIGNTNTGQRDARGNVVRARPPWPDTTNSDATPDDVLLWMIGRDDLAVWVPTLEQMTELHNQLVDEAHATARAKARPGQQSNDPDAEAAERRRRTWGHQSLAHA